MEKALESLLVATCRELELNAAEWVAQDARKFGDLLHGAAELAYALAALRPNEHEGLADTTRKLNAIIDMQARQAQGQKLLAELLAAAQVPGTITIIHTGGQIASTDEIRETVSAALEALATKAKGNDREGGVS